MIEGVIICPNSTCIMIFIPLQRPKPQDLLKAEVAAPYPWNDDIFLQPVIADDPLLQYDIEEDDLLTIDMERVRISDEGESVEDLKERYMFA